MGLENREKSWYMSNLSSFIDSSHNFSKFVSIHSVEFGKLNQRKKSKLGRVFNQLWLSRILQHRRPKRISHVKIHSWVVLCLWNWLDCNQRRYHEKGLCCVADSWWSHHWSQGWEWGTIKSSRGRERRLRWENSIRGESSPTRRWWWHRDVWRWWKSWAVNYWSEEKRTSSLSV